MRTTAHTLLLGRRQKLFKKRFRTQLGVDRRLNIGRDIGAFGAAGVRFEFHLDKTVAHRYGVF